MSSPTRAGSVTATRPGHELDGLSLAIPGGIQRKIKWRLGSPLNSGEKDREFGLRKKASGQLPLKLPPIRNCALCG